MLDLYHVIIVNVFIILLSMLIWMFGLTAAVSVPLLYMYMSYVVNFTDQVFLTKYIVHYFLFSYT